MEVDCPEDLNHHNFMLMKKVHFLNLMSRNGTSLIYQLLYNHEEICFSREFKLDVLVLLVGHLLV